MVPVRHRRLLMRAKESGRPCEDIALTWRRRGRFAVSDGASISYDSRGWACTLCRHFLRDDAVGPAWLLAARARFAARRRPPSDDWEAQHAAARGSFATFLGISLDAAALVAHAIGDTVLFVLRPDAATVMFPPLAAADFARDPVLLCDRAGRGAFADSAEGFRAARFELPAPPQGWAGTRLLALTDSLSEWAAGGAEPAHRLREIAALPDRSAFAAWVADAIAARRLRRDDCTALIVDL